MIFKTMTVGGMRAKTYNIPPSMPSGLELAFAISAAEKDGYEVLDVMDDILVIADGP